MRVLLFSAALGLGVALSGCAQSPPLANAGAYETLPLNSLPVPTGQRTGENAYVIGAFDELSITVWGVEGLDDRKVKTDASGGLSFPIAGNLVAAGLTPAQLEIKLAERLRAGHVRDPQVSVNVVDAQSHAVTVEGEVGRPGIYQVRGDMTLLKSIASAEGTKEYARNEVLVFRTVDERRYVAVFDLRSIRSGNYPDPKIYRGDIIVVGDSPARRQLHLILGTAPALLSPLVLLIR
jgi:polysaccharide export outer membrane protein